MIPFCRVSYRFILIAPFFATSLSHLDAQGVGLTKGMCDETAIASPAATRLVANLVPLDASSHIAGQVTFGFAAGAIEVTGRLDGLDPNKLYRLRVEIPDSVTLDVRSGDNLPNSDGNPVPPVVPTPANGDSGVLMANANGKLDIKMVLNGVRLADGEGGIKGQSVILTEIPSKGAEGAPVRVATASVELPEQKGIQVQRSRLDELEPGERWF